MHKCTGTCCLFWHFIALKYRNHSVFGCDFWRRIFLNQRIVKWVGENSAERFGYQQQLDYINRSADDLRSAKDIRLYQMAVWFTKLYEQNMNGMAKWYKKYTAKLFGVAVCDSGFGLVRECVVYAYLF